LIKKLIINSNNYIPSYVNVYNSLYSDIQNNIYLENDFLPSEVILAEKYGVSRNTLRQALAILNEDGLIIKSQGKGTIITRRVEQEISKKIINPMIHLSVKPIKNIDIQYNFNPATDIAISKLNLKKNDIVLASNNIYGTNEAIIGFSFVQIPMKTLDSLDIDLSDKDDINNLINSSIYALATKSSMIIKLIYAIDSETDFLKVKEGTPLILIESILLDSHEQPIARCKFYFLTEHYKLQFHLQ